MFPSRYLLSALSVLLTTLFLVACSNGNNNNNASGTIVEVAVESGDFETLVAALQATGLDVTLGDESRTFTVFAPTDEAFAALGEDTINALLADPETLSNILLYHVLADQEVDGATAQSLAGSMVETANGDSVAITVRDGELFINEAQVVTADVEASNGIIHIIDAVLIPPTDDQPAESIVDIALASGDFATLVAALQATGLDAVLADEEQVFTVFAPTDAAFAALGEDTVNALLADPDALSDILLYHVIAGSAVDSVTAISLDGQSVEMANGDSVTVQVNGDMLMINQAVVISADIQATNGVIHVIDAVLLPPEDSPGNIVEVAREAGGFTTLVAALEATGLDATLADEMSEFTVFAPTDDAFALLGEETINTLLDAPDTLSNILLYHVLGGIVDSETALMLDGSMVEMANGDTVMVSLTGESLFINNAQVIAVDIAASNGIIHVIDAVLMPPEEM